MRTAKRRIIGLWAVGAVVFALLPLDAASGAPEQRQAAFAVGTSSPTPDAVESPAPEPSDQPDPLPSESETPLPSESGEPRPTESAGPTEAPDPTESPAPLPKPLPTSNPMPTPSPAPSASEEPHDHEHTDGPTMPLTRELYDTPAPGGMVPMVIPAVRYGPQPVFRFPFAPGQRWGASGSHSDSDGIHRGAVDFAPLSSSDKRVLAVAAGTVYRVTCGSGWFLGIDHGGGWMSEYYHLTGARSALIGTWVEAGTHLGNAGQTLPCGGTPGNSAHVHLSILNRATDVPSGLRQYIALNGIQFDNYTLHDSSGAYNGVWRDLSGRTVLTSRHVTCCLTASSRTGPSSSSWALPNTDGNGLDDYSEITPWDTDLNGDGLPDIVGFGNNAVFSARSNGDYFTGYRTAANGWGVSDGWHTNRNPRMVVDVNNDGRADIVGFANAGVYVGLGNGTSFGSSQQWVADFGANKGWTVGTHSRTIVDVTGDGLPDVVGFGSNGIMVARNTGSSFAAPQLWSRQMGTSAAAGGWSASRHPRMVVDVNGDGLADIVGFGNQGVSVALNTGSGFAPMQLWVRSFGENMGWTVKNHPRHVIDVNGDGRPDVVGFGTNGVTVSLNTGSSFAAPVLWSGSFGSGSGSGSWRGDRHSRTLADVNGDGRPDIVGFGNAGTHVALNRGTSFAPNTRWTNSFSSTEWTVGWRPRALADVNGDGRADIVGFAHDGVHVALSTGSRFGAPAHWLQSFGHGASAGNWRVTTHPRAIG